MGLVFDGAVFAALIRTRRKVKDMEQQQQHRTGGMFETTEERPYTVWPPESDG